MEIQDSIDYRATILAGMWLVCPEWMNSFINSDNAKAILASEFDATAFEHFMEMPLFQMSESGIAVIKIDGFLLKGFSFFGATSTTRTQRAIRSAVADDSVKSILLHIDSPGGEVAGTQALADDVREATKVKPVAAHIDDLGASAAFWVASQASFITANRTALVGSIGTVLVVPDASGMAEQQGIKIHVISTGKFKGAGVFGSEITEEMLEMFQERVEDLNSHFLTDVQKGRNMAKAAVNDIADGRVHIAKKAVAFGLIDKIASFDEALKLLARQHNGNNKNGRSRADVSNQVRLMEMDEL